jgi:hypothetical protein
MIRQLSSIAMTAVLLSLQAVLPITAKAGDLTAPDGRGLSTNTDRTQLRRNNQLAHLGLEIPV